MLKRPTPSPSRKRAGAKKVREMARREQAVKATEAKYGGRAFDWKGKATCLHLTSFHLRRMGKRPPPLPQVGSPLAARRELAKRGWANVAEMLDGIGLQRIAPAFLRLGDLVVIAGDTDEDGEPVMGLGAIFVSTGERHFIGWADELAPLARIDVFNPDGLLGAWRIP